MIFRLLLLASLLITYASSSFASSQPEGFHDPLEHRLTLIQSRLMLTREHFNYFEDLNLVQSPAVEAQHLIRALQYSVCPLDQDQQQVRLNRIETFGIFLRLVALAEGVEFELPSEVPANHFMGLRLLKACQDGRHNRVLEAALQLIDDKKT